MNKVILIGRLTKDVDLRQNGEITIAKFSLAVDRKFKKENEQTADFINCVAFKSTAENIAKFFSKGNKIGVVGHIQTGSYTNKEGQKVYTTDVLVDEFDFIEGKNSQSNDKPQANEAAQNFQPVTPDVQDELPFK